MLPKRSSGTQEFMNPGKPFPAFLASWVPYVALVATSPRCEICGFFVLTLLAILTFEVLDRGVACDELLSGKLLDSTFESLLALPFSPLVFANNHPDHDTDQAGENQTRQAQCESRIHGGKSSGARGHSAANQRRHPFAHPARLLRSVAHPKRESHGALEPLALQSHAFEHVARSWNS